ncbi:Egl nine 1 [Orchesella cincta]|uniref:Egl nine 1 n=1 Tax=Orchesella cincta TaxID=48709 RepID=A0A1D2NE91_ORCCI|nr:Egl nine 1 [Orchesella cincta]
MHPRWSPKETTKVSSNSKKESFKPASSNKASSSAGTATPTTSSSPTSSYMRPKQYASFKYGGLEEETFSTLKAKEAYCAASKRSTTNTSSSSTAFKATGGGSPSKKAAENKPKSKLGKSPSSTGGTKKTPAKNTKNTTSTSSPRPTPPSSARKTPSSQPQRKGECEICKQICRSHCAGCKRVFYCSKQHQQQDWSTHKLVCRAFSIPPQYNSAFHLRPPGVSSTTSLTSQPTGSKSSELQFMITTKQINPGNVIFTEKPLFVSANIFDTDFSLTLCGACLQPNKGNNNGSTCSSKLTVCSECTIPLCQDCHNDPNGNSKRFHAGQGHSPEECAFISDFIQKHSEVINFRTGMDENGNPYNFIKDLTILRILMFRSLCPWRWESILALRNSPRFIACCKHNYGNLSDWLAGFTADFIMSQYYFKNICKEKSIPLTDVVKILAVFCEISFHNSSLLVLYENRSWIPHACTPNAEQFIRQKDDLNFEIIVKAVNTIAESSKVLLNYLPDFEGGRSALALKLFQNKGLFCCDTTCSCYQGGFDKTLGIRCDIIPSDEFNACCGILSPSVDAPNPDKSNLGLGMFLKSKKWECDKCKKSEKYGSLHGKIMEVAQELTQGCDQYCKQTKCQGYLQLRNKLLTNLSDQHWMVWKAKLRILTTWNAALGYGYEMLQRATSLPPRSPAKENLLPIIKQKVELYGDGIYEDKNKPDGKSNNNIKVKTKSKGGGGVLEFIGKRHGYLSSARGEMLFDAFYANLILLIEDYKKELPLEPQFTIKRSQIAGETCKKLQILRALLEQTVESLKVGEVTGSESKDNSHLLRTAVKSLDVLSPVCTRIQQFPNSIIGSMNELLQLYACQDLLFISTALKQSQHRKRDPCLNGLDLEFEIDKANCGPISLTFGTSASPLTSGVGAAKSSKIPTRFQKTNYFSSGKSSSFSAGESSNFFSSSSRWSKHDTEEEDDDDDDGDDDDFDNPFVYSSSSSNTRKNTKPKPASTSSKAGKSSKTAEDWSSIFDISSDDDDDDFDFGFMGSSPDFEDDLFNNDALEDLAEWAALQFMMGKMKKP